MPAQISIIIPVLNEAGAIGATLRSLAHCRKAGAELVVVDGGSEDATVQMCEGHADLVLRSGRGRGLQMNAGAAAACGPVLLFLHADTCLPDAAVPLVLASLATGRHLWGRFDVAIQGASRMLPWVAAMMNLRSRLTGVATGDQAIFVRRDVFENVGAYADLPLMEDIELSKRLRRLGPPVCLLAKVHTSGRRWDKSGVWRTIWLMWRLRLLYWAGVPADRLAALYR